MATKIFKKTKQKHVLFGLLSKDGLIYQNRWLRKLLKGDLHMIPRLKFYIFCHIQIRFYRVLDKSTWILLFKMKVLYYMNNVYV